MKRRVCAALLALVLALTLLPAAAFAEEPLEGGAAVEDVPSEPGNEPGEPNEPGGDEGDNEIPGDPSEENEDENTPGSEPGEENGDENTPGSEPGEENGDNETPTPQPNLATTTGGGESAAPSADNKSVKTWAALVEAIKGNYTSIQLDDDVTRTENDEDITISGEVTIELLGWTLDGSEKGPVITVEEGGKLTIEDASSNGNGKITGGEADNGGGIYVDGGTVTMTGGAISGNQAENGGGVYLTNGATFTMTGGEISENYLYTSTGDGGGVYVYNSSFYLNSADTENKAKICDNTGHRSGDEEGAQHKGGAIYAQGSETRVEITNGIIDGNSACDNSNNVGGGICAYAGPTVIIRNSEITNNSAFLLDGHAEGEGEDDVLHHEAGGGISMGNNTHLEMYDTLVSGNTALQGAGIWMDGISSAKITSCTITKNQTLRDTEWARYANASTGGGILLYSNNVELTITGTKEDPTVISGNQATQGGGGISVMGGIANVSYATIAGNVTVQGGGILMAQGKRGATYDVTIKNSVIEENTATYSGGGIWAQNQGEIDIISSEIEGNESPYGGGLGIESANIMVDLIDTAINHNTATAEAGGIYNGYATATMTGGSISYNEAPMAGGVENGGTFEMKDGTITGNEATSKTEGIGGGVANITGTFTMSGTAKLYGNTAGYGGDDFYNNGEPPKEGGGGLDIDDGWEGNPDMGLESLSATTRADDEHGTFTLIPATDFGYSGWFHDDPEDRYNGQGSTEEYEVGENHQDTTLQYLTLGEKLEPVLTLWYYQVYLRDDDGTTWLLWKHGQGGWAAPAANVKIEAADFNGQSLGWGGTLGDSYTHDSDNPDNRLSDEAQKANKDAPLKIYFEKKP